MGCCKPVTQFFLVVAKSLILLFAVLAPSILWGSETVTLKVLDITGKPRQEVEGMLGAAEKCQQSYLGTACKFDNGRVEVEFIDGKADWISVDLQESEVLFDYRAIENVGLVPAPPTVHNPFVMHWQGHQGLEIITVYSRGKYVALIQIRAITAQ